MTKVKCAKCEEVLREGILCIGIYHRNCGKVKAGEGKTDYVYKGCERKRRILGVDNAVEVIEIEEGAEESGHVSDSSDSLRSEIQALKAEIASLKEIIRVLNADREVATSAQEKQYEGEWTVTRDNAKRKERRSANFLELKKDLKH